MHDGGEMSKTPGDVKAEITEILDKLRAVRDASRLKLHLASMDARDEWSVLDARIKAAERLVEDATEAGLDEIVALAKDVSFFMLCL
jgi:hypothetical protein